MVLKSRDRIRINVSGHYFETHIRVLDSHPSTLLGDQTLRRAYYDRRRDELFFDRHRPSFEAIFAYYQYGGRLKRPHNVPDDVFLTELLFYRLEKTTIDNYKVAEGYTSEDVLLPSNKTMRKIWMLFEYPETSRAAYAVAIVSVFMTLISIVLFCVETLPIYATTHCTGEGTPNFRDPFFVVETICTAWFTVETLIRFVLLGLILMRSS